MQIKTIIFLIAGLILALSMADVNAQNMRVKDGRQYYLELAKRLDIPKDELYKVFSELRSNMPKDRDQSSLVSGLDSMAKVASAACAYVSYLEEDGMDVKNLYNLLLDRDPTPAERKNAILNAQKKTSVFANCFYLALHPEFILLKESK